jgi:hypothetical protein
MAYDWENPPNSGTARAPRIPASPDVNLTVRDVVFGSKKGGPFKSSNGDPQVMLVYADDHGNEATEMVTLSDKAAWKLAQLLSASGANMKAMKEKNITPTSFTDERFARANLVNRKFRADLQYEKGNDGKEYARVTPLRQEPAMAGAGAGAGKSDDPIPF